MKHPYTLTAYVRPKNGEPTHFQSELALQTNAHAAGVGDTLKIELYTLPAVRIHFTAPPDPFTPLYPTQTAQDAMVKLLNAEIKNRWPASGKILFKLETI